MNPLSPLRACRLARPHLLALAAVLAVPATVGAQATNNWRCADSSWNDSICWSLGTPISSQNVVIPPGPTGTGPMLLRAIGNTVSVRSIVVGSERTEATSFATGYLDASGSTITVADSVNIGTGMASYAQMSLTNSTLNSPRTTVGAVAFDGVLPRGYGVLSVQENSRINGSVVLVNGRLDLVGGSISDVVSVQAGYAASSGVANIAGNVNGLVQLLSGGSITIGTAIASIPTPVIGQVAMEQGAAGRLDFVGRSAVTGGIDLRSGVTTVKGGASVLNNNSSSATYTQIRTGGQLVVESGGALVTNVLFNGPGGSIDLKGGTINHRGIDNAGTVSGTGWIDSNLDTQTFKQQQNGLVRASGGDLNIWGNFDGLAGGSLATVANSRLIFNSTADFKAGQVITQSGNGGTVVFRFNVNIGSATERGSLEATTAHMELQGASNLSFDFGSLGAGDHDYLYTAGQIRLGGGTLTLRTVPGALFGQGASFNVLRATSGITGTFGSINTTAFGLAPGARLDVSNLYTTGTVAVVPEPATWLSLGAGLLLIGARARRWRQQA